MNSENKHYVNPMKRLPYLKSFMIGCMLYPSLLLAQTTSDTIPKSLTLEKCVTYALANRPAMKQALIDEAISDRTIKASLSDWFPQITAQFAAVHNIRRQTAVFGDEVITLGTSYNSNVLLQAEQVLYSNDVLLASKAARYDRLQYDQNTVSSKISTVVEVSKAFYDILFTQEQLRILNENIVRQEKQYNDAFNRYEGGLVDKTDYQRASISLANSRSSKKRTQESIKAKYAYLKELMGVPPVSDFELEYDHDQLMQQQVLIDTTQTVAYASRIEYRQLQTQQQLLQLNTSYYKLGFLPTVSAYINYNPLFFNNSASELYKKAYPTSAVGIQATIPIFQGTRRIQNRKRAQLQEDRLEIDLENTRNIINTEYQTALANYKSDYNEWLTLQKNAQIAEEVYTTIKLQYDEGVKAYVDLIIAETDLQTAQLNYYNALYRVLASKLDYEKALGIIDVK